MVSGFKEEHDAMIEKMDKMEEKVKKIDVIDELLNEVNQKFELGIYFKLDQAIYDKGEKD